MKNISIEKFCQINECTNNEVPLKWKLYHGNNEKKESKLLKFFGLSKDSNVNSRQWISKEDIEPKNGTYINLLNNPEEYTNYLVSNIRNEILKDIFYYDNSSSLSFEDKILGKIIKGWFVNTNFYIGCNFKNRQTNYTYVNISFVTNKFLDNKENIDNLFFLYSLMLKALNKSIPFLLEYNYSSGNISEDEKTIKLIKEIFINGLKNIESIKDSFKDSNYYFDNFLSSNKIPEIINKFKKISTIINCETCPKLRIYEKLEFFGIGTMLKILFSSSLADLKKFISRNELVSFINLFAKLSQSVNNIQIVNEGIIKSNKYLKKKKLICIIFVGLLGIIFTFMLLHFVFNNTKDIMQNKINNNKNKSKTE